MKRFFIIDDDKKKNAVEFIDSLETKKGFVVEIKKGRRTISQNSLFHYWVSLMAKESGMCPEDMKIAIKRKILGMREIVNPLDNQITYTDWQSSTMNKEQFSELMTHTQIIAGEFYGMTLPSPNDVPEDLWR